MHGCGPCQASWALCCEDCALELGDMGAGGAPRSRRSLHSSSAGKAGNSRLWDQKVGPGGHICKSMRWHEHCVKIGVTMIREACCKIFGVFSVKAAEHSPGDVQGPSGSTQALASGDYMRLRVSGVRALSTRCACFSVCALYMDS